MIGTKAFSRAHQRQNREPGIVAITGAARGIGRATADAFLKRGYSVAIGDLDAELAQGTATELSNAYPHLRVIGLAVDVRSEEEITQFVSQAMDYLGTVDVLVNNAGIMPTGLLVDEPEAFTQQILDVNVKGVVCGTRVGLKLLPASGTIVNVASQAALVYTPALATYCASKAAVHVFGQAMRRELERKNSPHLCTVLPGIVRTELSSGTNLSHALEPFFVVDPQDVAEAIVDGVLRSRHRVFVPVPMGIMIRGIALMPYPLRRFIERTLGADRAFVQADPEARRRYHGRVSEQTAHRPNSHDALADSVSD